MGNILNEYCLFAYISVYIVNIFKYLSQMHFKILLSIFIIRKCSCMKRLLAPIYIFAVFTAVMCGCSASASVFDWVVEIDGEAIAPAPYIVAEMQAYIEAQLNAEETDNGVTVDNMPIDDWISARTIENLKETHFIDTEFATRQLEISDERLEYINMLADGAWENVSGFYTSNGIGVEYYRRYLTQLYKRQMLFADIYMSDEMEEEIDTQVKRYLAENLSKISIFAIPRINDDSSPLDEEQAEQLLDIVEDTLLRLEQGEEITRVAGEEISQAAALLGSVDDFSDGSAYVQTGYLNSVTPSVSSQIKEQIVSMADGTAICVEGAECYHIVYKQKLYETEEEYRRLKYQVVTQIKDQDYNQLIAEKCAEYQVIYNEEACKYYSPSKIVAKVTE